MANLRRIHHKLVAVRHIKTWQLLIVIVLLAALSAFFLRQNNLQMLALKDTVKQADENNKGVSEALLNLQHFVANHMNTSLGDGIALQYSYQRAYTAAVEAAANATNPQAAIYTQVELACRPVYQRTHSFPAYTQCAHDQLSQLQPGVDPETALKTPSPDLYRYNFASPIWSPDLAGFSVLLAAIAVVMLLFRLITYLILWAILRAHR